MIEAHKLIPCWTQVSKVKVSVTGSPSAIKRRVIIAFVHRNRGGCQVRSLFSNGRSRPICFPEDSIFVLKVGFSFQVISLEGAAYSSDWCGGSARVVRRGFMFPPLGFDQPAKYPSSCSRINVLVDKRLESFTRNTVLFFWSGDWRRDDPPGVPDCGSQPNKTEWTTWWDTPHPTL